MRGYVDRIRAAGAELYVIGNGSPEQARAFAVDQGVRFPLYTDPSLASYEVAGFENKASFSPSTLWNAAKAMTHGHFQTRTQGTATQNGGAFVLDRGGRELFAFRSKQAGDHPDPDDLIAALSHAPGATQPVKPTT